VKITNEIKQFFDDESNESVHVAEIEIANVLQDNEIPLIVALGLLERIKSGIIHIMNEQSDN